MIDMKNHFHLQPGEIFVSSKGMTIATVLGSCVAVCLWDRVQHIGGMNHVVLPKNRDDEPPTSRFANVATFVLYDMMMEEGSKKNNLVAQVFGGANRLAAQIGTKAAGFNIGELNLEITLKVLQKLGLPVVHRDCGGPEGRKILFDTKTGEIEMNMLHRFDFDQERQIVSKA